MKKTLLLIALLIPIVISAQLSGTYTISSTGTYTSFTAAVSALTTSGINGPVVFNVSPGTYNEQITIPAITGASTINTITFQSANGDSSSVILNYNPTTSTDNFTIKLNGAQYLIIKELTLKSSGTGFYGMIVEISNDTKNIKFLNNYFAGSVVGGMNSQLVYTKTNIGSTNFHNLKFENNFFQYGNTAIWLSSNLSTSYAHDLLIKNNIFFNQHRYGIFIGNFNNPLIEQNRIRKSNIGGNFNAILINGSAAGFRIEKNYINLSANGIFAGINIWGTNSTPSSNAIIRNNFVMINSSSTCYGISIHDGINIKIKNNNVLLRDTAFSSSTGVAFRMYGSSGNFTIKNNIFYNAAQGLAFYSQVSSNYFTSDYNNLLSNGNYIAKIYGGASAANIAGWNTLSNGDYNSVSINPMFFSNTDLHVSNPLMDNLGTPDIDVTDDFDGQPRSSLTPDIGADEFSILNTDLSPIALIPPVTYGCYSSSETIKIKIKNYGISTVNFSSDTAKLYVNVSGVNPITFPVMIISNDSIKPDSTKEIIVSSNYNMSLPGLYNFNAILKTNNDGNAYNDTMQPQALSNVLLNGFPYFENIESFSVGSFNQQLGQLANGWTRGVETTYKTYVNSGITPNNSSGPSVDHTTNLSTGKYICFFGSGNGTHTELLSPCIDMDSTVNLKLKFWYHMYGAGINSLNIDVFDNGIWQNNVYSIIGQQQTSSSAPWQSAIVDLSNYTGTIKVKFRAVKGNNLADVGLDDFFFGNAPFVNLGNDTTICFGDTITIDAGQGSNYTYSWKKLPSSSVISTSQTLSVTTNGTYIVEVTNQDGFPASDTIVVGLHPVLIVNAGNNASICAGENFIITSATANNYDTLFWSTNGSGYFQNNTSLNTVYYPDSNDILNGFVNLILNGTSFCGNISDTLLLTINPLPYINAGINQTIPCGSPGVTLGSGNNPNYNYLWSPGTGLSNSTVSKPVATPTITTVYTLSVTDTTTGCSTTDHIIISVMGPTAIASNDTTICAGDSISLSALGGTSFHWNTGDTTSTISINPISTTTYTVTVTSGLCSAADTVIVFVNTPSVALISDTGICYNESIILDAGLGFSSYLWSTGEITQTITVDSTGIGIGAKLFYVLVEDNIGCEARDSVIITIKPCDMQVSEKFTEPTIKIFPNPTTGKLNIIIENTRNNNYKLCLYNSIGSLVYCKDFTDQINYEINLTTYPKGIYYLRFENRDFVKVEKIVVQ